jgi:hypothetical protein
MKAVLQRLLLALLAMLMPTNCQMQRVTAGNGHGVMLTTNLNLIFDNFNFECVQT